MLYDQSLRKFTVGVSITASMDAELMKAGNGSRTRGFNVLMDHWLASKKVAKQAKDISVEGIEDDFPKDNDKYEVMNEMDFETTD